MNATSWRATINSRTFAFSELCIVAISGAALCLDPQIGIWAVAASLLPWGFKFAVGAPLFRRTRMNLLLAIFLLTACTGFWAAYDRPAALQKLYTLLMAIMLYFALRSQPKENMPWISFGFFCIGVGLSAYFFLTHDFVSFPRKIEIVNVIGRLIMRFRPDFGWSAIHPNYIAGFAAIAAPFGFYVLLEGNNNFFRALRIRQSIAIGLLLIFSAIVMTTSRGILMALAATIGVWCVWRVARMVRNRLNVGKEAVFPILVLMYLASVVFVLYQGPAQFPENGAADGYYGNGSRGELVSRSIHLLADYPITGGGLSSFPGLYSQYILNIPYYQLPNSHNLFLDVFIEQGLFGGSAFLLLFVAGIWRASQTIATATSARETIFCWAALGSLVIAVIHGSVDDYLYNANGALFSLALVAVIPNPSIPRSATRAVNRLGQADIIAPVLTGVAIIGLILMYQNTLRSIWYSNLGAVQMARVELNGFPTNQWADAAMVDLLQEAETSLLTAVEADPSNRTANHRLGLIALLRRDFSSADIYLSRAYQDAPRHRGILKSLGFCKAWLGDFESASSLLSDIPEASSELDVYAWWWEMQGRSELAANASALASRLAKP